jgi:hypothetical protein
MKAFIEKVFKMKQQKQKELLDEITNTEVIQENKAILSKEVETSIKEKVKQNVVEVKEHTDTKSD